MNGVECKWEQVQDIMEGQRQTNHVTTNDRSKRGLRSIIEELQKNQIQNSVCNQQNNSSLEDFESILCDTTSASDSIIDTPSSIPPPKRRRRLERLNGTTTLSTAPSALSSTTGTTSTSPTVYTSTTLNNNNYISTSNNNQSHLMKHERLSPGTPDTSSRSLTPSSASHPDTPPAQDMMLAGLGGSSPLLARNYSDIMRNLAAKYNNSNPNDYFSRNGFPLSQPTQPPASQSDRYKPHLHPSVPPYPSFSSSHLPPSTSSSNSSTDLNNPTPSPKTQASIKSPQVNNSGPSIPPCRTPTGTMGGGEYNSQQHQQHALLNNPFTAAAAAVASASGNLLFPPLIDMSSTQALLALVRTAKEAEVERLIKTVKPRTDSPLDLSSGAATGHSNNGSKKQPKIVRTTATPVIPIGLNLPGFQFPASSATTVPLQSSVSPQPQPKRTESASPQSRHHETESQTRQVDITTWSVDDVCKFIAGIDICAEYEQNFRDQSIDGSGLPLLTEDHLVKTMRMRLGPALKLRSLLAKKIGSCSVCLHCNHCHNTARHDSTTGIITSSSLSANSIGNRQTAVKSTSPTNNLIDNFNIEFEPKVNVDCENLSRRDLNVSVGCMEGGNVEEGRARDSS